METEQEQKIIVEIKGLDKIVLAIQDLANAIRFKRF